MSLRFRVLGSGSGGNATLVEGGGARVLLDAGLGPAAARGAAASRRGWTPPRSTPCFVSHEHGDHARGAARLLREVGGAARGDAGHLPGGRLRARRSSPAFEAIAPGETRTHPAGWPSGRWRCPTTPRPRSPSWSPSARCRSATPRTSATSAAASSRPCAAAHALLVESNYDPALLRDGPYPWSLKERILGPLGHLSNGDVARLLERGLGEACRQVVLAHLSRKNNHPELALQAAEEALERAGRRDGGRDARRPGRDRLDRACGRPARPPDGGTGSCASSERAPARPCYAALDDAAGRRRRPRRPRDRGRSPASAGTASAAAAAADGSIPSCSPPASIRDRGRPSHRRRLPHRRPLRRVRPAVAAGREPRRRGAEPRRAASTGGRCGSRSTAPAATSWTRATPRPSPPATAPSPSWARTRASSRRRWPRRPRRTASSQISNVSTAARPHLGPADRAQPRRSSSACAPRTT